MARVIVKYLDTQKELADRLHKALQMMGYVLGPGDGRCCYVVIWSDDGEQEEQSQLEQEMFQALARDELLIVLGQRGARLPFGFQDFNAIHLANWKGDIDAPAFQDLTARIDDTLTRAPYALPVEAKSVLSRARRARLITALVATLVGGGFVYQAVEEFGVLVKAAPVELGSLDSITASFSHNEIRHAQLEERLGDAEQALSVAEADLAQSCSPDKTEVITHSVTEKCNKAKMRVEDLTKERAVLAKRKDDLARKKNELAVLIRTRKVRERELVDLSGQFKQAQLDRRTLCLPNSGATVNRQCDDARSLEDVAEREMLNLQSELSALNDSINEYSDIDAEETDVEASLINVDELVTSAELNLEKDCDANRLDDSLALQTIQCNAAERAVKDLQDNVNSLYRERRMLEDRLVEDYRSVKIVSDSVCREAANAYASTFISEQDKEKALQSCNSAQDVEQDLLDRLRVLGLAPENQSALPQRYQDVSQNYVTWRDGKRAIAALPYGSLSDDTLVTDEGKTVVRSQMAAPNSTAWTWLRNILPEGIAQYGMLLFLALSAALGGAVYMALFSLGKRFNVIPVVPPGRFLRDPDKSPDIFVASSPKDGSKAIQIVRLLKKSGLSVWFDKDGTMSGEIWAPKVIRELQMSKTFVLLGSQASYRNDSVFRNMNLAAHFDLVLQPLLLDSTEMPDRFSYFLASSAPVKVARLNSDQLRAVLKDRLHVRTN